MTLRNRVEPAGFGKVATPGDGGGDPPRQPEGSGESQADPGVPALSSVSGSPNAGNRCGVTNPVMPLIRWVSTVNALTANGI
jgi:hypothetical protein